ncbi:MAG: 2-hydroxyacid dehydrogenase [Actinomycetales bacterium]
MLRALVPEVVGLVAEDPDCMVYADDPRDVVGHSSDEPLRGIGFYVPLYMGPANNFALVSRMPDLQVLQLPTIGFDHVLPAVRELRASGSQVVLCNATGVHEASTAELAIGLAIAMGRRIDVAARDQLTHTWDHRRGSSLANKRILIIGAGGVGRCIAQRFTALGCQTTMVATVARDDIRAVEDLPALLPQADIVILAVPHLPSTEGLVDASFLAQLADGALLINVARGPVVRTDALVAALRTGRIRAALDVTDPEPLPAEHPLWDCPNLLITPHVGGHTDAFPDLLRSLVRDQLRAWRAGEPLRNVIAAE